MSIKIRMDWGEIFILQIFLFLLIIHSVTAGNEGVRGDMFFNIELFGVKSIELQAPEVYINQSFWARATIRVNQSYDAGIFNATIELPSSFSLPDNDYNHSNPEIVDGFGAEYLTNWTVNATVSTAGNYTINVSVPFFNSSRTKNITVNQMPPDWINGNITADAGGPYNFTDTGIIYATLTDSNGVCVNIMGGCNTTIYYPNSSVFRENQSLTYLNASYGQYYYNFIVPNTTGNYTTYVNCSIPLDSNYTSFEVVLANQPPYFTNPFPITGSYIHRSDNNPTPTQMVDFWIYVTDPDGDPLNVSFIYSTDGKQTWTNVSMTYDSGTGTWVNQVGNYPPQTIMYYYVNASDSINPINRTPATGYYDYLVWDYPPARPRGPTGGVVTLPLKGKIAIIDYPDQLEVIQGETKTFSVFVKNTGDKTLKNVTLFLESIFPVKITPVKIEELESNAKQIFLIEIEVPEETEPKDYILILKASSQKITTEETIILTVLGRPVKPEIELEKERLKREIDDLTNLINKVWNETFRLGLEGKNVTQVFELLGDAKDSLALAENYWAKGNYTEAKLYVDESKKLLEDSVVLLGKIKYPELVCPIINISFLSICLIYWFSFITLGVIIIIITVKLRKKPSHYKPQIDVVKEIKLIIKKMKTKKKWYER